jgi:hypothetical protein
MLCIILEFLAKNLLFYPRHSLDFEKEGDCLAIDLKMSLEEKKLHSHPI